MNSALKALRDLRVNIPGPIDSATGEPVGGYSFRLHPAQHSPKNLYLVSDVYSTSGRMQFDFERAFELAVLFDEEKSIPAEHNIKSVIELFTDPVLEISQKLDLVILYLRRVHFFCYYLGKRFRDEAHLTAVAPNILFRIPEQISDVSPNSELDNSVSNPADLNDPEGKVDDLEVVPLVDLEIPYSGRTEPSVQNLDR